MNLKASWGERLVQQTSIMVSYPARDLSEPKDASFHIDSDTDENNIKPLNHPAISLIIEQYLDGDFIINWYWKSLCFFICKRLHQ